MSSSTSSSEPSGGGRSGRARSARILLLLLAALVVLELVTRTKLVPASKDLSRFRTYAARARALAVAPSPRVALIGNSTTERGVLLDLLKAQWLERTGVPLSVDMFVADGSAVNTWYWIVAHDFWKQRIKPDLLVVTYYGSGLADSNVMEVGRVAQFFTDGDDRPTLFAHDLLTLEQRADFLLSSASQMFAARDRIRERALDLIPGYQAFTTATNAVNFAHERRGPSSPSGAAAVRYTYRAFHRFVDRARQEGVQVCFVAFPNQPERPGTLPYQIDAEVLETIAAAGMLHLDLRQVAGLAPALYEDDIHLNEAGRPIYTRRFAEALVQVWPGPRKPAASTPAPSMPETPTPESAR